MFMLWVFDSWGTNRTLTLILRNTFKRITRDLKQHHIHPVDSAAVLKGMRFPALCLVPRSHFLHNLRKGTPSLKNLYCHLLESPPCGDCGVSGAPWSRSGHRARSHTSGPALRRQERRPRRFLCSLWRVSPPTPLPISSTHLSDLTALLCWSLLRSETPASVYAK